MIFPYLMVSSAFAFVALSIFFPHSIYRSVDLFLPNNWDPLAHATSAARRLVKVAPVSAPAAPCGSS